MKDMLTLEMQSLRNKMRSRLKADKTLSPAYCKTVMKMLEIVISEIEAEQSSLQRISLAA
jgi:hypothetical protein